MQIKAIRLSLCPLSCVLQGLKYSSFAKLDWFNTISKSNDIAVLSKIGYLPIIDASPTELSTFNEIIKRSLQIADSLQLQYICLVFDEAIYVKVQQIRWKKEAYMNRLIV